MSLERAVRAKVRKNKPQCSNKLKHRVEMKCKSDIVLSIRLKWITNGNRKGVDDWIEKKMKNKQKTNEMWSDERSIGPIFFRNAFLCIDEKFFSSESLFFSVLYLIFRLLANVIHSRTKKVQNVICLVVYWFVITNAIHALAIWTTTRCVICSQAWLGRLKVTSAVHDHWRGDVHITYAFP